MSHSIFNPVVISSSDRYFEVHETLVNVFQFSTTINSPIYVIPSRVTIKILMMNVSSGHNKTIEDTNIRRSNGAEQGYTSIVVFKIDMRFLLKEKSNEVDLPEEAGFIEKTLIPKSYRGRVPSRGRTSTYQQILPVSQRI